MKERDDDDDDDNEEDGDDNTNPNNVKINEIDTFHSAYAKLRSTSKGGQL